MKIFKKHYLFIAAFFLAGYTFSLQNISAQESAQCLAVITGKSGNVLVKKAGSSEFTKAGWGTQLFKGDQISTESASEVNLTFINGNVVTFGPGSTMTFDGINTTTVSNSGNVKKVTAGMMSNMSALTRKREARKDVGALAGLRSVSETAVELVSPGNTVVRTDRPDFRWLPDKPYDRYVINLYNSQGLVWSAMVSENSIKFPEKELNLMAGETYFWNVEGEDLIDNRKSSSFTFSVLSAEKAKEVADQELQIRYAFKNDTDSSSLHSFLGAYYMNQGLLEDAIKEFETISLMNPDAPLPHEILGSLYSDIGKKDRAIAELQKALELAKGQGGR